MNVTWNKLTDLKVLPILFMIAALTASVSLAQKNVGKGIVQSETQSAGRGGGTKDPTPTPTPFPQTNPLPQTAPAPDVVYRESFGEGPNVARPAGSKGILKETYTHTPISNFWIEYPGSKDTQWIAPSEGQTWRLCAASANPFEMFSPIQMTFGNYMNGCVASEWTDQPTQNPTALMPFTAPNTAYEVAFDGYPAPIAGKYLALGLTNSSTTYSNLENAGSVVLFLKPAPPYQNSTILYELRAGGQNGTLLAAGETYFAGWNQMKLTYDPVAKIVGASVNGTSLGSFPLDIAVPRYAGFEGVGIGDNFVIRKSQ